MGPQRHQSTDTEVGSKCVRSSIHGQSPMASIRSGLLLRCRGAKVFWVVGFVDSTSGLCSLQRGSVAKDRSEASTGPDGPVERGVIMTLIDVLAGDGFPQRPSRVSQIG